MLTFSICIAAMVVICLSLESLIEPMDYNSYIRELKLNIPGMSEQF